jgi:hypothetical protein
MKNANLRQLLALLLQKFPSARLRAVQGTTFIGSGGTPGQMHLSSFSRVRMLTHIPAGSEERGPNRSGLRIVMYVRGGRVHSSYYRVSSYGFPAKSVG